MKQAQVLQQFHVYVAVLITVQAATIKFLGVFIQKREKTSK